MQIRIKLAFYQYDQLLEESSNTITVTINVKWI
jgi:hypothetical protein